MADWEAFEDAKIEGYRRAQHRFIEAGGSGKHDDPTVIPSRGFTLSIMFVPPGHADDELYRRRDAHLRRERRFVLWRYMVISATRSPPTPGEGLGGDAVRG